MKKEINRLLLFLILLFISSGIFAVIEALEVVGHGMGLGLFAIFKTFPHLPTSIFDLIESCISSNWTLTNVSWIDTMLLNIVLLIPSVIIFIINSFLIKELSTKLSGVISIIILILVLELFSSLLFWIILVSLIISIIIFGIYKLYSNKKFEKDSNE